MSAARGAASSCRRSSSGRYQRSTAPSSAGHGESLARSAAKSAANSAHAGATAGGGDEGEQLRRRIAGPGERGEQPRRARRADAGNQLQRAQAGALAARIGGEAQHGQDVLDVRRVEETAGRRT